MTKNQRLRQRANRQKKRELKRNLKIQNQGSIDPISKNIDINKSFLDYAVDKTKKEIRKGEIDSERLNLLEEVIRLRKKINPERSA